MPRSFDRQRGLDRKLHKSAERRAAPSAAVVFEAIRHEGEQELERPLRQLALSGLAAGLALGFSFLMKGIMAHRLPDESWALLISTFGYCTGYIVVILGRQQMYTETPLIGMLPFLNDPQLLYLGKVLRLWGVVLAANTVGAFLFAWTIHDADFFTAAQHAHLRATSVEPLQHPFVSNLLGGVFAGWLVALIIWLLPFAETGRVFVILLLTYMIGIAGFPHIVAGAAEAFYAVLSGVASWGEFVGRFFVPVLIGNTLGGVFLVAALNYGQVAPPADDDPQ